MKAMLSSVLFLSFVTAATAVSANWDPAEKDEMMRKVDESVAELLETDPDMQRFFDAAAGYVVIPNVGKGGIGVGGAYGRGVLYEGGVPTKVVRMSQMSIGFQWGGQAYRQFMFFEKQSTVDTFKDGNFKFSAQASAVAVTAGASADASFKDGVAVFTMARGGLMYEASVAGQKFSISESL